MIFTLQTNLVPGQKTTYIYTVRNNKLNALLIKSKLYKSANSAVKAMRSLVNNIDRVEHERVPDGFGKIEYRFKVKSANGAIVGASKLFSDHVIALYHYTELKKYADSKERFYHAVIKCANTCNRL